MASVMNSRAEVVEGVAHRLAGGVFDADLGERVVEVGAEHGLADGAVVESAPPGEPAAAWAGCRRVRSCRRTPPARRRGRVEKAYEFVGAERRVTHCAARAGANLQLSEQSRCRWVYGSAYLVWAGHSRNSCSTHTSNFLPLIGTKPESFVSLNRAASYHSIFVVTEYSSLSLIGQNSHERSICRSQRIRRHDHETDWYRSWSGSEPARCHCVRIQR